MAFVAGLGILVFLVLASVVRGFVLSIMWSWFLVPLGVPAISIPLAIGISMLVAMLTNHDAQTNKRGIGEAISIALIGPFVVLALAWVVTLFM